MLGGENAGNLVLMTAAPTSHSIAPPARQPELPSVRARRLTGGAGAFLALLGLTVMAGWLLRLPGLLQVLPGYVGMVFSAALCFALAGAALLIPGRWPTLRRRGQSALGGLIVLAAGAMLVQYLTHTDLGIDLRPFHAWLSDPNPTPGRMAPNTALAFLLSGMALMLLPHAASRVALRTIEILAFLVAFIGLTGAVGYALKLEFLYGWYEHAHMPMPTAAGMIVLGIGLLSARHQLPGAGLLQQLQAQNRIIWIGGSIFFTIALVAGLGGFAIMQQRTETTLQNSLQGALQNRGDFFAYVIGDASSTAQLIATRPAIYRHLHKLNTEPGNATELGLLAAAAKSFLPLGFSSISFHDKHGKELVRAGTFVQHPELAVSIPLSFSGSARLAWRQGFLFEVRLPMREAGQHLGTVVLQRPLAVLTRMLRDTRGLGETGEMAVCAPAEKHTMWCFPLRANPKVLQLPYEIDGRRLPMSYALDGISGVITALDYRRQNVTAAYGPIGQLGLGMVLKTDTTELYKPIGEQLGWALFLLLSLIALGMWILHLLVTPLVRRVVESEEKYRAVAESANEAIVTADSQGRIVYWNRAAQTIFGYSESQILGEPTTRLIQENYRAAHQQGWDRLVKTEHPRLFGKVVELRGQSQDGREFPLEMSLSGWHGADGERYFTGIMRDITRRKQGEQTARQLADIVESSSDAIYSKNLDDVVTSWNTAAERLYGYSAAEIIGQSSHVLLPPDKIAEEQNLLERLRGAEHVERHETMRVKKDSGLIEVAITISPLRDASGHIIGTSTIARDITERKRREEHTRVLTVTDELTGLHNRRGFVAIAEQQLKLARRSRAPLHIGFIDLDGMKAINDRFGHAVGDEALKDTAAVLRASFRDSDVLARVGGDEFVVLTIGADDKAMELIQERLFAAVAKANREAQHPYALSLSLGVVACDIESGATLDQMIEEADRRMYLAKGEKRRADRHKTP